MVNGFWSRNHAAHEHVHEPEGKIMAEGIEERVKGDGLRIEFSKNITKSIGVEYGIGSEWWWVAGDFLFPYAETFANKPFKALEKCVINKNAFHW